MSNVMLFHMWAQCRQGQIDRHMFYVDQARARLLSRFEYIEVEADRVRYELVEAHSKYFDPDRHDPSVIYDGAIEAGLHFYEFLSDMKERSAMKEQEDLEDEPADWPFPQIPAELYWSLPEADRMGLEQIIRDMVAGSNTKH